MSGKFTAFIKSVTRGQKLEEKMHIKELCQHMEIEITGSDLTENKLFFYMYIDTGVVEAKKSVNKVTTETGFSCNPTCI